MVYKRAVKVSDPVYSRLRALASRLGFESPNALLEELLEWWGALLESKVLVDGTWVYIELGGGRVAFNIVQVGRMCRLGLLPKYVCVKVKARVPWL